MCNYHMLWNAFLNQVPLLHIACEKTDLNLATLKSQQDRGINMTNTKD